MCTCYAREHCAKGYETCALRFLDPNNLYKQRSVEMLIRALATRASIARRATKHALLDSLTPKTILQTPRLLRSDYYKHKCKNANTRSSIARRSMKYAQLDSLTKKIKFRHQRHLNLTIRSGEM